MIKFNLDKEVGLTFYDQIKGQLLSAIYCGKIKEGDRLPSIRELAEAWISITRQPARSTFVWLAKTT